MRDKIICLVGASGSGKTTIAKELEGLGYNIIHSYTTRKPREKGEWGHRFVGEYEKVYEENNLVGFHPFQYGYIDIFKDVVAIRKIYNDIYFATKKQYQGKGTSVYVVDPDGAEQVKENVKDAEVMTIFLMVDMYERIDRLEYRLGYNYYNANDKEEKAIHHKEVIERTQKDQEIFKTCKCDYVVDGNTDIKNIIDRIWTIIR